jgi:hypothetical protein
MIFLILATALAGDALEQAAEESAEQVQEVQAVSADLNTLAAYLRDEDLVAEGHVPLDWAQPSYEVYEATLQGRPSMLPMIAFVEAAGKAELDPILVAEYVEWTAAQIPILPSSLSASPHPMPR